MLNESMSPEQIKEAVMTVAPVLRERGVTGLFLFGSTIHGDATEASDVDLFLDFDPASRFSLFDQMEFEALLGAKLGRQVDLMTRGGLHPLIKDKIVSSAFRLF